MDAFLILVESNHNCKSSVIKYVEKVPCKSLVGYKRFIETMVQILNRVYGPRLSLSREARLHAERNADAAVSNFSIDKFRLLSL